MHFEQPALEATLLDYVHEVDHAAERIERLEKAIDEAIAEAPAEIRAVVEALAGSARRRADDGRHHCCRTGYAEPI